MVRVTVDPSPVIVLGDQRVGAALWRDHIRGCVLGSTGGLEHGRFQPVAGEQGDFNVEPAGPQRSTPGLFGLADPILGGVAMQEELLGSGRVAAAGLEEDAGRLSQTFVAGRGDGQVAESLMDPGPCGAEVGAERGDGGDLGERGDRGTLVTGRKGNGPCANCLAVAAAETFDPGGRLADRQGDRRLGLGGQGQLAGTGHAGRCGQPGLRGVLVGSHDQRRGR